MKKTAIGWIHEGWDIWKEKNSTLDEIKHPRIYRYKYQAKELIRFGGVPMKKVRITIQEVKHDRSKRR